jgi:hypothetical protein
MNWTPATALQTLTIQLNSRFPNRSKISDGTIGDQRHKSLKSDHNPNAQGVVCARDFTHDPIGGIDCNKLATSLFESRDDRIKYIIWNGRITTKDLKGWTKYGGSNRHDKHLHLSVNHRYNAGHSWKLGNL